MSDDEISGALVEERVKALRRDAEAGGYILNPDEDFVRKLARGICINEKRYGYRPAPAGLPSAGGRRTATSSARVTTAIPISRSSGPVTVHSMSHPQSRRGRRPSCPSRKGARRGPQENQWAPSPEESRDSPCRSGGAGCAGTSVQGRPRPSSARSARRRKTGSNASCKADVQERPVPCREGREQDSLRFHGREESMCTPSCISMPNRYCMAGPVVIEIVGLKDSSCSPFPCDNTRSCGLYECHPTGKLVPAFEALKKELLRQYGDAVRVTLTLIDEEIPPHIRDIIAESYPPSHSSSSTIILSRWGEFHCPRCRKR